MWVYEALRALKNLRTHGTLEAGGTVISTPMLDGLLELARFQEFSESLKIQLFLELSGCWGLCSSQIFKGS